MNSKTKFDLLGNISHVNPPPYLLTRIQERIKKKQQDYLSPQWAWSMLLGLILIGIVEIAIMSKPNNDNGSRQNLVQLMNLQTDNVLYHE